MHALSHVVPAVRGEQSGTDLLILKVDYVDRTRTCARVSIGGTSQPGLGLAWLLRVVTTKVGSGGGGGGGGGSSFNMSQVSSTRSRSGTPSLALVVFCFEKLLSR